MTIGNLGYSFSTDANNGPNPYTFTLATSTTAGTYSPGNYAVFSGMSSSSFTINETRISNCGIAAVEIVQVPTPSGPVLNLLPVSTPVTVASGATLDLGGSQTVASLSDAMPGMGGIIQNSGTSPSILTLSATGGSTTFSGVIAGGVPLGSISLVMSGSGLQVLSGSNTYTGGTTVGGGTLAVNGSLASAVTVNGGGCLSGTGYFSSITVTPSGQLAPGDGLGIMNVSGSLNLLSGAVMDFQLDTPSTSSQIIMPSGQLVLTGQQLSDFDFTPTSDFEQGNYLLVEAGSITGSLGLSTSGTVDGLPATLAVQGNDLVLNVVPEPSTPALLGAGAIGLAAWAWRFKRARLRV